MNDHPVRISILIPNYNNGRESAVDGQRDFIADLFRSLEETLADDPTPVEGPFRRIAVFGGVYNNHYALVALLEDARRRQVEAIYCLGDLGGVGPNPEKVRPLLG